MKRLVVVAISTVAVVLMTAASAVAFTDETLVTVGSPTTPFSQNKQNEPAITADANSPDILVAGANDNIDMEACNAGADNTCPFTQGVGVSGVYFSFDDGTTWTQPTYTGWSARNCQGTVGPDAGCTPVAGGPIGTLPWYYENGLVSDGDPGVAIGPKPGPGGFKWTNGERLYYSNLTANFGATRTDQAFKGFEAIGVSRTDDIQAAASGDKNAWCTGKAGCAPVLISRQSSTTFSDKSQIWVDNASSSQFFGTAYVCWASFVGQEKGNAAPAPLQVAVSHDGGDTWSQHQISGAANNGQRNPEDGCTIRTDSKGNAYVFGEGTSSSNGKQVFEMMSRSGNGGRSWSSFRPVAGPVTQPGVLDPVQGRPVIDGVAGARSDLSIAPSVDIASGAPTGADATDRIVMTYVSGTVTAPHVYFTESTDRGTNWSTPRRIESKTTDRGIFTAPAISPNGTDVYVVYNAFTTPFRDNTTDPRSLVGVVLHADSSTDRTVPTGAFSELNRSTPGDPRASSANALTDEFLGDYVYATATRNYGAVVWNDTQRAADCPAIDNYRMKLQAGMNAVAPAPEQDCAPDALTFGNSDIFGGSYQDPTP
ncbi:MAG TPA: sialidase family protein [Solirubrobacteraceae bacterium]|nr:sialidase family protein [Solirubrobacteraceae bacterium]